MYERLKAGITALDIDVSDEQAQRMLDFADLLIKWNKTHNLTAITQQEDVVDLHLLDSLSVLSFVTEKRILDVGSGGGFPGIVLAIMLPETEVVSVDTRGKKIQFQLLAANKLGLKNFHAKQARIEEFTDESGFSQIISRAFSSLENFTAWTDHLLQESGEWLAMKGKLHEEEVEQLVANEIEIHPLTLPNNVGERHLLLITRS